MEGGLSAIQICEGFTGHERHLPKGNAFRYPVLYIRFDTEQTASVRSLLSHQLKFFSFRAEDYLFKKTADLDREIRALFYDRFNLKAETVHLITIPRLFGYVFNPVSFWLCRAHGELHAVLCEVNNTFGERHFYWVKVTNAGGWIRAEKCFHVSPFLPVEGFYQFRFLDDPQRTRIDINYFSAGGEKTLSTWLDIQRRPLTDSSLPSLLFKYGWVTALVLARIHLQALRLFFKRIRFYSKPELPQNEVS